MTMEDDQQDEGTAVRGDRFSGGPARGFLSSLENDTRIFDADIAVDRAHVVMLAEQGIIESEEAGTILGALSAIESAGHTALPDSEDVHEAIESAVIDRVGTVGGKMHTARSRNDEVAACIRYRLREDLLAAIESTIGARSALAEAAADHTDSIMPGFTHLQPAQPTTIAHWLLSYEQALGRDTERLLASYDRTNLSPLGGAASFGTPFDIDRARTAELLGFDGVIENSMDASSTRDFLLEATAALAGLATALSGLAEDLIVFTSKGYVEISDAYASTSSIMPQKKNPDTLELVRATAGTASSGLNGLLTLLKGVPRAYNRDLQEATGFAWETVDSVTEATDIAAGAIATATWNTEELANKAGEGFSVATGVADLLAMHGIAFRTAHEILAHAADEASDPGIETIDQATLSVLDEPLESYVSRGEVEAALDPSQSVESRDSFGGPGRIDSQLLAADERLTADRTAFAERSDALSAATEVLMNEVDSYV